MARWHHRLDMNLSKLWEIVKDTEAWCQQSMGLQRVRHDIATEKQQHISVYASSPDIQIIYSVFKLMRSPVFPIISLE